MILLPVLIIKPKRRKNMKKINLKIKNCDDRRLLAGILADNGYNVKIKEGDDSLYNNSYCVIVEIE